MSVRSGLASGFLSFSLGVVTLAGVAALLLWDAFPSLFPAHSHETLGAFSLVMIALAYLVYQWERRAAPPEAVKAILLAAAFLFWAANQFWPNLPQAGLFNDIAIGLFVLDRVPRDCGLAGGATERFCDSWRDESQSERCSCRDRGLVVE